MFVGDAVDWAGEWLRVNRILGEVYVSSISLWADSWVELSVRKSKRSHVRAHRSRGERKNNGKNEGEFVLIMVVQRGWD